MTVIEILDRLECVQSRGMGKWLARCPGHADRSPSLSVREIDNKILLFCHAGCDLREIVEALGLTKADLFTNRPTALHQQNTARRRRVDLTEIAFKFELGAVDRRLRTERFVTATANFNIDGLTEKQLDRVMDSIAAAFSDQERADFLESMADHLRVRAYEERTVHHVAN